MVLDIGQEKIFKIPTFQQVKKIESTGDRDIGEEACKS